MPFRFAREIRGRILEQKEVETPVAIVVEKRGVGGEARVGDTVLGGGFCERTIAVVDTPADCVMSWKRKSPLFRYRRLDTMLPVKKMSGSPSLSMSPTATPAPL